MIVLAFLIFMTSHTHAIQAQMECEKKLTSVLPGTVERVSNNDFNVGRGLFDYLSLMPGLYEVFGQARDGDIYLDAGAGLARAQTELLAGRPLAYQALRWTDKIIEARKAFLARHPKLIAMSYAYPTEEAQSWALDDYQMEFTGAVKANRLTYLTGDLIDLNQRRDLHGKVALITDVASIRYSNVNRLLEVYLKLLKPGGKLFLALPAIAIHAPTADRKADFEKWISVAEFLRSGRGYTVEGVDQIVITRTFEPISLPDVLIPEGLGVVQGSEGADAVATYEWVRTADEWLYSRHNPNNRTGRKFRGRALPADFKIP